MVDSPLAIKVQRNFTSSLELFLTMLHLVFSLLVLKLVTAIESTTAHHYYVTAANGSDCPPSVPCHPLKYYVQNPSSYFTSDTVVEFLPGLHELNHTGHVYILQANNLTLVGSDSSAETPTGYSHLQSVVFCTDFTGFFFNLITDLKILNMRFSHCGSPLMSQIDSDTPQSVAEIFQVHVAIAIVEVHGLELHKVTVEKSFGYGLLGTNIWNRSIINDSHFVDNNEYIGKYQQCIDPNKVATCSGGNARLTYIDHPGVPANNTLEIINSEFLRGIAAIDPEPHLALSGGLDIIATVLFGHNIHITINNTVIAGNSGFIAGNMIISIYFGAEHVKIRIDRCHIHSGKGSSRSPPYPLGTTGLVCDISFTKEHSKGNTMPLHISNTNFTCNAGGVMMLTIRGRSNCVCNSSGYQVLMDSCKFFGNTIPNQAAVLSVSIANEKETVTVQETVLKVHFVLKNTTFHQNIEVHQRSFGALMVLLRIPEVTIINSTFDSNFGSRTVAVHRSKVVFEGQVVFQNNTSTRDGGALYLDESSLLHFKRGTMITFINNTAAQRGGAIFVESVRYGRPPSCFFELDSVNNYLQANVQLVFKGNRAEQAGDALYGGEIDQCSLFPEGLQYPYGIDFIENGNGWGRIVLADQLKVFESLFNFTDSSPSYSLVTSNAHRVCLCNESVPDFAKLQAVHKTAYPGQTIDVESVAVGQYNGTVPSVIIARTITSNTSMVLREVQLAQQSKRSCTRLQYTISSVNEYEVIQLYPTGAPRKYLTSLLTLINVTLLQCPPGFAFQNASNRCDCHPLLSQYNVTCDINNQTITKADTSWISFDQSGVVLHPDCPFDYCELGTVTFKLTEDPDIQCAFNRRGVLCGGCKPGFSLALGTSRCLECSSIWIFLLIPFAAAGLALVFLLLILNLTVSTGTINGLIFYANIVRANHAFFFPPGDSSFFSVFIAWLNLDLGIETCFWNGLDGYMKTWLQFAFPVYIWVIVVIIILLSRRFVFAAKLCGSHTVKVLATLFLLSYAKVLRTIITALSFTTPTLLVGPTMTVWLYDGNINYLGLKHTFLFLTALGFAFMFVLPFTLLVLLAPCLQAWSNKRFLRWVHRLKPLLDAYQGPYTDKFRCWTGVMLVVRNVLFLAFAVNGLGNPVVNLEIIITVVLGLQAFMWIPGRVYKVFLLNVLEAFFIVKLGVLSAWTIFIHQDNPNSIQDQTIAAYTITTITVVIFSAIVCYHVYVWLKGSHLIKGIARKYQKAQEVIAQDVPLDEDTSLATRVVRAPTVTFVEMNELRESLLSGDNNN